LRAVPYPRFSSTNDQYTSLIPHFVCLMSDNSITIPRRSFKRKISPIRAPIAFFTVEPGFVRKGDVRRLFHLLNNRIFLKNTRNNQGKKCSLAGFRQAFFCHNVQYARACKTLQECGYCHISRVRVKRLRMAGKRQYGFRLGYIKANRFKEWGNNGEISGPDMKPKFQEIKFHVKKIFVKNFFWEKFCKIKKISEKNFIKNFWKNSGMEKKI
jgi:hypothetical protein